jgi:hypothetical protein
LLVPVIARALVTTTLAPPAEIDAMLLFTFSAARCCVLLKTIDAGLLTVMARLAAAGEPASVFTFVAPSFKMS